MSCLEDGSFKLLSPVGFSVRGLLDQDCLSFKLKEKANSNQPYSDSSFNESLFLKKSQSYIPLIYCLKLQLAKEYYCFQNKHPFENGAPRHSFQTIGTKWSRLERLWLPFGKNAMIIRGFSSIQSQSMKNCKWISTSILAITIITARSQLLKRIYYYTLSRQKSVVV